MNLLEINHLQKIFNENRPNQVEALKDISLNVETGDFIAIMGNRNSLFLPTGNFVRIPF